MTQEEKLLSKAQQTVEIQKQVPATSTESKPLSLAEQRKKMFNAQLDKQAPDIATALAGSDIPVEKFLRIARTVCLSNPNISGCEINSIMLAIQQCAEMGLEPSRGQAHFVPFKDKVKLIIGWQGVAKHFYNHYLAKDLTAEVIYEKDYLYYEKGRNKDLKFKPDYFSDRGKVIGFYAQAELKNGGWDFVIMSVDEIKAHATKYSKAFNPNDKENVWVKSFDEMALKTVILKVLKKMPSDILANYTDDDMPDSNDNIGSKAIPTTSSQPPIEEFTSFEDITVDSA